MKLRNKKTGEITDNIYERDGFICVDVWHGDGGMYDTLAELNEEWEDYEEEEKEYYTLNSSGQIWTTECFNEKSIKDMKSIGNYFETKEEAEKAVEKLKAWKRLKDAGVTFKPKVIDRKWYLEAKAEPEERTFNESHDLFKDVMLIIGGEE